MLALKVPSFIGRLLLKFLLSRARGMGGLIFQKSQVQEVGSSEPDASLPAYESYTTAEMPPSMHSTHFKPQSCVAS